MSLRTCWIWRTSMWSSHLHLDILWGFSGDSDGKESTCNAEAWVWSLSWEDLLEEGIATHFSILAWRIPMDRGTWWATVHGTAKSQTWLRNLDTHTNIIPFYGCNIALLTSPVLLGIIFLIFCLPYRAIRNIPYRNLYLVVWLFLLNKYISSPHQKYAYV